MQLTVSFVGGLETGWRHAHDSYQDDTLKLLRCGLPGSARSSHDRSTGDSRKHASAPPAGAVGPLVSGSSQDWPTHTQDVLQELGWASPGVEPATVDALTLGTVNELTLGMVNEPTSVNELTPQPTSRLLTVGEPSSQQATGRVRLTPSHERATADDEPSIGGRRVGPTTVDEQTLDRVDEPRADAAASQSTIGQGRLTQSSSFSKERARHRAIVLALQLKMSEQQGSISEKQDIISELQAKISDLQSQLVSSQATVTEQATLLAQCQISDQWRATAQRRAEDLETQAAGYGVLLRAQESQLHDLQEKLQASLTRAALRFEELQALEGQVAAARAELQERDAELAGMRGELVEEAEWRREALRAVEEVKEEVGKREEEERRLRGRVGELEGELRGARQGARVQAAELQDRVTGLALEKGRLYSVSWDGYVRVHSLESGHRQLATLNSRYWAQALALGGGRLYVGNFYGSIQVWDADKQRLLTTLPSVGNQCVPILGLAVYGDRLFVATRDALEVWDCTSYRHVATLGERLAGGQALLAGDGVIYTGFVHGVKIWCARSHSQLATLVFKGAHVSALARDGRWLFAAGSSGMVQAWDMKTHDIVARFESEEASPTAAVVVADGFLYQATDKDIQVWQVVTCKRVAVMTGHSGAVTSLASCDDGVLFSGATDHIVQVGVKPD
eukprot:jgi/Mesvir1/16973/Mv15819-RA.1